MKIRIARTVKLPNLIVKKTLDLLMPHTGPMQYMEETKPLMFQDDYFSWDAFFSACTLYRGERNIPENDFLVILTELHNDKNWFSAFSYAGERTIFIHAEEWENYIYCEPELPLAYEVIANVLQSLLYAKEHEGLIRYIHYEPIGCMNDMCGWKHDISLKLRTGDICSDCLSLLSLTTGKEIIKQSIQVFESLRKKMVFNCNYQKPLSFEEHLPFTIAITKRKLSTTLEPFRKMLMLIDHFDSIVRTASLMIAHLTKSKKEVVHFLEENNLSERPSLGSWVNALAKLAKGAVNYDWGFQLPSDFSSKVQQVITLANESKITFIRNEQRGHGYIDCQDSGYKQSFQSCLPVIEEMERLLSPLFYRFKYYHVINIRRTDGQQFVIRAHKLSGSNPAFIEEEIETTFNTIEQIPIENRFYVVTPDNLKWYDLDPYFKYGECNICHHNRLLVFDGIYMLDPYIGHRFQKEVKAAIMRN